MKRLLLGVVCVFVGGVVAAVRITNVILDRLDKADRGGQVVPIRIRAGDVLPGRSA